MSAKSHKVPPKQVVIDPTQAAFEVPQCAIYTGLSHWKIRMAIWQGLLPARKAGKSLLILRADADAFLKSLPAVSPNSSEWVQRRKASLSAGRAA